ncbi:MAG: hypothetical protein ACJARD_001555 [Alphaproteobacteria bacterium]|jgi:hypothetical protein
MDDIDVLQAKLAILEQQHRDLDDSINALSDKPMRDELQIKRLKKQKLYLRDQIHYIIDELNPDILA